MDKDRPCAAKEVARVGARRHVENAAVAELVVAVTLGIVDANREVLGQGVRQSQLIVLVGEKVVVTQTYVIARISAFVLLIAPAR